MKVKLPTISQVGPIGMDFGIERLNLVQASFTREGPGIRSALSIAFPSEREQFYASPKELKSLIKEARSQGAFKGNHAVVSMPPDKVQFVSLEYKYTSGMDPNEAVVEAIKERFSDHLGSSVIDFLHIRPEHKEQVDRTALVAVSERKIVIDFLEFLRKGGLAVDRLEIGPVAINRLVSAMNQGEHDKVTLVINFGLDRSYATVLWGRRLLLDRALSFGLNSGLQQVAEAMEVTTKEASQLLERHGVQVISNVAAGMDYEEPSIEETLSDILKPSLLELSAEIKRLMLYVASKTRGRNIHKAYIFGSLSGWSGIDTILSEMTGLPLQISRPLYGLKTSDQAANIEDFSTLRSIAVATGLSLMRKGTNA